MRHDRTSRAPAISLSDIYPDTAAARRRVNDLIAQHQDDFDPAEIALFSAPGRTELGGNHTDHNNGSVLASAVQLDALAAVSPRSDMTIRLTSRGFDQMFVVDLSDLQPKPEETGTSSALIRGVAAGVAGADGSVGGFDASVDSRVLPGSGLSSSASFEILVATILNVLYNDGGLSSVTLSKISQAAENDYFGKPCGLMDQIACSTGGIVAIDFEDLAEPVIRGLDFSFREHGMELLVVDTGGNHADLTPDYAAVPAEMRSVAGFFGRETLRGVTVDEVLAAASDLREKTGDRAVLRALHFLNENRRVDEMVAALSAGDLERYLDVVTASGDSSWELLQNCYTTQEPAHQGITTALALTRQFLVREGLTGTCRVHGGGFAGTIQAYVPIDAVAAYTRYIQEVFGPRAVTPLTVRSVGATPISDGT